MSNTETKAGVLIAEIWDKLKLNKRIPYWNALKHYSWFKKHPKEIKRQEVNCSVLQFLGNFKQIKFTAAFLVIYLFIRHGITLFSPHLPIHFVLFSVNHFTSFSFTLGLFFLSYSFIHADPSFLAGSQELSWGGAATIFFNEPSPLQQGGNLSFLREYGATVSSWSTLLCFIKYYLLPGRQVNRL